jgi:hypothetical protein
MNSSVFWDIIPCISLRVNIDVSEEHIASIFRFKTKPSKKPETKIFCLLSASWWLLAWFTLKPENRVDMFHRDLLWRSLPCLGVG